jgi:hypothetical protein
MRTKDFHPMGTFRLEKTPLWMSCGIPVVSRNPLKNDCRNVKFDGWSVGHVLIYASIGFVLPCFSVFSILGLSLACEAFEYAVGWRARWIIDPAANLAGYFLGRLLSQQLLFSSREFLDGHSEILGDPATTVMASASLALILLLNRPAAIPNGGDFH